MIRAEHIAHMIDDLPEFLDEVIDDVLAFFLANDVDDAALGTGDDESKRFVIAYHLCKRTLLFTCRDGEITGAVMWHRLRIPWTWGELDRWRPDDPEGKDIVLSAMLANDRESRRQLLTMMATRIPDAQDCSFRGLRSNKVMTYKKKDIRKFYEFNNNNILN